MSSRERKAEKRAEWEAECERQDQERRRVNNLSLSNRIDEADSLHEMKEVLRLICERAGIDIYA
jgi:hypothetical protein